MNNVSFARIFGSEYSRYGQSLLYKGSMYHIDRNDEFVKAKNLPCIAENVISAGGQIFNIYRGFALSALGSVCEFAAAVKVGQVV